MLTAEAKGGIAVREKEIIAGLGAGAHVVQMEGYVKTPAVRVLSNSSQVASIVINTMRIMGREPDLGTIIVGGSVGLGAEGSVGIQANQKGVNFGLKAGVGIVPGIKIGWSR